MNHKSSLLKTRHFSVAFPYRIDYRANFSYFFHNAEYLMHPRAIPMELVDWLPPILAENFNIFYVFYDLSMSQ